MLIYACLNRYSLRDLNIQKTLYGMSREIPPIQVRKTFRLNKSVVICLPGARAGEYFLIKPSDGGYLLTPADKLKEVVG